MPPEWSERLGARLAEDGSYGSDSHGIVWAYRLSPTGPSVSVPAADAEVWLASVPGDDDSFLWLHLSLANAAALPWLRRHLRDATPLLSTLGELDSGTRLELEGDGMLAVLHDVHFDFGFDPAEVSTVGLWVDARTLVSVRLRPLRSIDRLRLAVRNNEPFRSPADLLARLLREQAGVLMDIVRRSARRVDEMEDRLLAGQLTSSRRELGALRRVLVRLQRLLAPEPAALFRILARPPRWVAEPDHQELRQAAEELNSAVADSSVLAERVKLLQEELVASLSERTNRTLFVLTLVTVLALPINLTAALFGMNVGGVPLADSPTGFARVSLGLLVATAALAFLAIRARRP
jgi:zinc transporter